MARVEPAAAGVSAWLVSRSIRYFFVLLASFGILIASIVFAPQFLKFAAGTFPIAWVLNLHGALMTAWLVLFLAQALLASTGRLALHRKLGAIYQRRHRPTWHKRFMLFATFLALQAAEQRITWLPRFAPGYWTDASGCLPSRAPHGLRLFLGKAAAPGNHCRLVHAPGCPRRSPSYVGKSRVASPGIRFHRLVALHVLKSNRGRVRLNNRSWTAALLHGGKNTCDSGSLDPYIAV